MPELPELFAVHHREVSPEETLPIDVNWLEYCAMEASGRLIVMTMRDDKILVGYYISILFPSLHYNKWMAISDMFYVLPEYRKSGKGLVSSGQQLLELMEVEQILRGAVKSFIVTKVRLGLKLLLKRLGYAPVELIHAKRL